MENQLFDRNKPGKICEGEKLNSLCIFSEIDKLSLVLKKKYDINVISIPKHISFSKCVESK